MALHETRTSLQGKLARFEMYNIFDDDIQFIIDSSLQQDELLPVVLKKIIGLKKKIRNLTWRLEKRLVRLRKN